jgi:predicted MPP superfamily phosphohydrolase
MTADASARNGNGASGARKIRVTRRRVVAGAAALAGLSVAATAAYAAAIEPRGLIVTRYVPSLPSWPAGRKLSVTVIADLHSGGPNMLVPHVQHVIDTANGLNSDLVVLLGDYIARYRFKTERLPDGRLAAELARLKAPLGVWAILGNHDWWYEISTVRRALADAASPFWKTTRSSSERRAGNSGLPALAISSRISSGTAASAAKTTCRARWRRSERTIPSSCSFTSRIFFRACPTASR